LLTAGEGDDQTVPCSLANVLAPAPALRHRRRGAQQPHGAFFDTLARFRPSGIMELTATPDTVRAHAFQRVAQRFRRRVEGEEMIKLPVVLETEPNWQQCLADAIARRGELHATGGYRPAQRAPLSAAHHPDPGGRSGGRAWIRWTWIGCAQELTENHRIPAEEIVVATGEERGLEKIEADFARGIADEACAVRYSS
jgi:type III restriction enzyme